MSVFHRVLPSWLRRAEAPSQEGALADGSPTRAQGWWRGLAADQSFWGVAVVWALCWLAWAAYLDRFANSLPWADDYAFILSGVATGEHPVTWEFLWAPANEHRAPLTRLWVVWVGRLVDWDFRHMLQIDLAVLALGCLTLLLAVRAARGRSSFADAFLPLLILSSAQYETLALFAYAYAMALGVWCATAAAVLVKWQVRSIPHLLWYLLGALVVAWAGGPAGNLWALGLCVPLALGWSARTGRAWKACAALGGAAIAASVALLIYCVPPSPAAHHPFRSDSLAMTLRAAAKCSVGWMGNSILQVIWPWALLVLLVPMLYLLVRFLGDVCRHRGAAFLRWVDLGALLLPALAVTAIMGYARAKYPGLWSSRYVALEIPIAVVLFLMLVRCTNSRVLAGCMAVGMAICVGWNWPAPIDTARAMRPRQVELARGLRAGHEPLSVLVERCPEATGWCKELGVQHLLGWWQQMRAARISVFAREADAARQCLFRHADIGSLFADLRGVGDPGAVAGRAMEAASDGATAVYEVAVAAGGPHKLCCRWLVPSPGRSFSVAIDGGPPLAQAVPAGLNYAACPLGAALTLTPGTHRLTVTWPGTGSRLDVLELTPQ